MGKEFVTMSKLTFGKHKGETIYDVAQKEPQYLLWCRKNIEWFNLSENCYKFVYRKYCEVEYWKAENYCMSSCGWVDDMEDIFGGVDQGAW